MGPVEILVVVVIALLVLGPERMLSHARTFGKVSRDLRNRNAGLRRTIQEMLDEPFESLTGGDDGPSMSRDVGAHPEAQSFPGSKQPRRRTPGGSEGKPPDDEPESPGP
jgi:Sec-independent protein translocase protein TatA